MACQYIMLPFSIFSIICQHNACLLKIRPCLILIFSPKGLYFGACFFFFMHIYITYNYLYIHLKQTCQTHGPSSFFNLPVLNSVVPTRMQKYTFHTFAPTVVHEIKNIRKYVYISVFSWTSFADSLDRMLPLF